MKTKKIFFSPNDNNTLKVYNPPKQSSSFIPEWYKKIPKTANGDPYSRISGTTSSGDFYNNSNHTVKMCTPILDTFTSGYMITFPADLLVKKNKIDNTITVEFSWKASDTIITQLDNKDGVLDSFIIPNGYLPFLIKVTRFWNIETPIGYSSLITHPFNRYDLPFLTVSSILDTDQYGFGEVVFFLKNDFEGVILEGTPIAQIFPYQRDNWVSNVKDFKEESMVPFYKGKKSFFYSYKNKFWTKKRYQ